LSGGAARGSEGVEILTPEEAVVEHPWSAQEWQRLTRLCAVLSGDPASAEDLAQETMLQAWRIRHRLVDPTGHGPWLDAVARHVCRRWRTRHARLAGRELAVDRPEEQPDSAYAGHDPLVDLLEQAELAELLERALALLPPETRDTLVARYVEDLGPREIARRLGMSEEAVSMRLTRGRARMRQVLETDLADEPLARIWLERHGPAWRSIRISCTTCGRPTTSMRRDGRAGTVSLRCEACEPDGLASSWSLSNPALAPHLDAVRRPSAVIARMAAWAQAWWLPAIEAGHVACTRCGADVAVRPYRRTDCDEEYQSRGWYAACARCGEVLSTSLLGLAQSFPATRDLRARRPRARALPARRVDRAGRPALVVGLGDDGSGDRVEVLFDDVTSLPVGLVASR
jgi:RNA polymerase sigma factor (sigma-70 family)